MFRCGDPRIAQPEGRFAETGSRRYGEEFCCTLFYDPAYVQLTYPGGDVPQERGVCSDVVIRA
ncbi:hypothetical protein CP987_19380, partial [Morganella morganii]